MISNFIVDVIVNSSKTAVNDGRPFSSAEPDYQMLIIFEVSFEDLPNLFFGVKIQTMILLMMIKNCLKVLKKYII